MKGWQWSRKEKKRVFMEIRNECDFPLAFQIVRVKATGNYFVYVRPSDKRDPGTDTFVPPKWFEVIPIGESEF